MYKKFEVIKKVRESRSVISLYLKPADDNPLEEFLPGQHLLFKFHLPGHEVPTFRYYSFSDFYNDDYYRISIKKECTPDKDGMRMGLCSSYLFDIVEEGDLLEAKGPSGEFYILPEAMQPLALIAGGIGITPLLSMLKSVAKINPQRELYFFYGVNDKGDHSFQNEINQLKRILPHLKIYTFYNKVVADDLVGLHYDYEGLITIGKIQELVASAGIHYYICGPGGMMTAITTALKSAGVAEEDIHTESFNLELNPMQIAAEEKLHEELAGSSNGLVIEFKRSGKKLPWDHRYRSILEFAEAHDIEITSGCLFGDCGTCLTKVQQGTIQYIHPTTAQPGIGRCLPCSCVPSTNLVLEA